MPGHADPRAWSSRPIREDEREWAFALEHAVMGSHLADSQGIDESEHRTIFDERIFDARLQVIEVGDERAGLLKTEIRADELHVAIIELDPAWQGRGVGGEIVQSLLADAARAGVPLTLDVLASNRRAVAFYERHGLRIVTEAPDEIRMSAGDAAAQ